MITVITGDARYDLEAASWLVTPDGQLEVWKTGTLAVAIFAPGRWHGVIDTRQLMPEPAAS